MSHLEQNHKRFKQIGESGYGFFTPNEILKGRMAVLRILSEYDVVCCAPQVGKMTMRMSGGLPGFRFSRIVSRLEMKGLVDAEKGSKMKVISLTEFGEIFAEALSEGTAE